MSPLPEMQKLAAWPALDKLLGQNPNRLKIEMLVSLMCVEMHARAQIGGVLEILDQLSAANDAPPQSEA